MIKFSFIIPHKNTPDLLQKCLDSIPRRDDVQIIVVDDNSDGDKVDFDHFPGLDDPTVEVYLTKEGRGAGYARNVGLSHAIGKWLVFADADDFFNPCITEAMDECEEADADVVFFKNTSIKLPSGTSSFRGQELNRRVDIALNTGDFTIPVLYSSPWQKFFKRGMVEDHGIRFNEVCWGNDVVFMGRVAAAAQTFAASDKAIYCITESDNSIIKTVTLESCLVRYYQESENLRILRKTKYAKEPSVYYWHFMTWFNVWKQSKMKAFSLIPHAVHVAGFRFIKQAYKIKSQ